MSGQDDSEMRLWLLRRYLYVCRFVVSKRAHMRGQSTIFVMDESFVHEKHVSAFTWNATGEDGKAQRELAGTKGRGKMLIMCGGITVEGPMVTHSPCELADDANLPLKLGPAIIDSAFLTTAIKLWLRVVALWSRWQTPSLFSETQFWFQHVYRQSYASAVAQWSR
jgi:hypothetical protein